MDFRLLQAIFLVSMLLTMLDATDQFR